MPKMLTEDQIAAYRRDGYLCPLRAMAPQDMAALRVRYDALCARDGGTMSKRTNQKPHLLVTWLDELVRHPRILDAVEDVIGPNILCWASGFFHKPPHNPGFVSWHQDSTYWGLSSPDVVTAWVAFEASTPLSGCMRVIPGTQTRDQVAHRDTFAADNLLSRGQEIQVDVDEKDAVDIVLQPGEFSLHHVRIIHGSEPNNADWPRIGFTIRYVPTHVRQIGGRDSAMLVRGVDEFRNFDPEPRPAGDFHPDAVAFHGAMIDRVTKILFAGAPQAASRRWQPAAQPRA
jgi:non-heme Fe2+,alpha-ketoglutarate-dependent halogenase